jgi:hypothetical protein
MMKNSHSYSKDDFMSRDVQSIGVYRVEPDDIDLRYQDYAHMSDDNSAKDRVYERPVSISNSYMTEMRA